MGRSVEDENQQADMTTPPTPTFLFGWAPTNGTATIRRIYAHRAIYSYTKPDYERLASEGLSKGLFLRDGVKRKLGDILHR